MYKEDDTEQVLRPDSADDTSINLSQFNYDPEREIIDSKHKKGFARQNLKVGGATFVTEAGHGPNQSSSKKKKERRLSSNAISANQSQKGGKNASVYGESTISNARRSSLERSPTIVKKLHMER